MKTPIWEGIYRSFSDVPSSGEGYASHGWVQRAQKKLMALKQVSSSSGSIPLTVTYKDTLLPVVVSLFLHTHKTVRILDFGGGLGWTYIQVCDAVGRQEDIYIDIVDVEQISSEGELLWESNTRMHFFSQLPLPSYTCDIAHVGSSLQYVDAWKETVHTMAHYHPEYIVFTDLPAGDVPTYVTSQWYHGSRVPYRFFNMLEFVEYMKKIGYVLMHKSRFISTILGKEQPYPQENFPKKYRIGDSCNLIFASL